MCLIDIGGGTTDLAVWTQGAIRHTVVIPIAGDQITNDIAMALRTPTRRGRRHQAQVWLCAVGIWRTRKTCSTSPGSVTALAQAVAPGAGGCHQPRVEELFELIQAELRRSGFEDVLSSGIVLTGGASVMPGMIELGEEIFHMPVRLGVPKYQGALADVVQSPRFATACGLLLEAQTQRKRGLKVRETRDVKQVFGRMKSWFEKNF
jgi:cell division protein FtsA